MKVLEMSATIIKTEEKRSEGDAKLARAAGGRKKSWGGTELLKRAGSEKRGDEGGAGETVGMRQKEERERDKPVDGERGGRGTER
eukprot:913259-Rhodomonas_salina.1